MSPLEGLNEKQIEAVKSTEGQVRIIAGAGTGKTRTLAHRYAYLVKTIGIDPSNILCLTFTNKAAQEMRSRITEMLPSWDTNDFVCTIHSFCTRFLRKEIHRVGYPKNFSILDSEDQRAIVKKVMKTLGLNRSTSTVERCWKMILEEKDNIPYIDKYMLPGYEFTEEDQKVKLQLYLMEELKTYSLDFHDLIFFTEYILTNFHDAREYWTSKFDYIMVDEAQDISALEWPLLFDLSEKKHNLFLVGDPDQAIYGWRGADTARFYLLKPDKDCILNKNYRSTPEVLAPANSLIASNTMRVKKDLYTDNPHGEKPFYFHGRDTDEEASWVVGKINELHNKGVNLKDIAVLFRSSYISKPLEVELVKEDIQYIIWGGIKFYERKEIKDAVSYLRLVDHDDDQAFRRIVNIPSRKVGPKTLQVIEGMALREGTTLYSVLKTHLNYFRNRSGLLDFVDIIERCRAASKKLKVGDLLDFVLDCSGLLEKYRFEGDRERLENLDQLKASAHKYTEDAVGADRSLAEYLQDISLLSSENMDSDKETLRLMTIHQAKGLEFDYVFIVGVSEGIMPNHRSIIEAPTINKASTEEEERRLMFVAMTRAKKALFITDSEGFDHVARLYKCPSRYLLELGDNNIDFDEDFDKSLFIRTRCAVIKFNIYVYGEDNTDNKEKIGEAIDTSTAGYDTNIDTSEVNDPLEECPLAEMDGKDEEVDNINDDWIDDGNEVSGMDEDEESIAEGNDVTTNEPGLTMDKVLDKLAQQDTNTKDVDNSANEDNNIKHILSKGKKDNMNSMRLIRKLLRPFRKNK